MINYTTQYQTQFEVFSNLCQLELDPGNRWIQLGALLPWDHMVGIYVKRFSPNMGAGSVNPRWVIGAFIIKLQAGPAAVWRLPDHQTISWDAYNEGSDLQDQAETYRLLTGHYPELIQCDKI